MSVLHKLTHFSSHILLLILLEHHYSITLTLIFSSIFAYTFRAFGEPPRRALIYWNKHFRTDELLGAWLFLFGTLPAIPYALVYFMIDPNFTYLGEGMRIKMIGTRRLLTCIDTLCLVVFLLFDIASPDALCFTLLCRAVLCCTLFDCFNFPLLCCSLQCVAVRCVTTSLLLSSSPLFSSTTLFSYPLLFSSILQVQFCVVLCFE